MKLRYLDGYLILKKFWWYFVQLLLSTDPSYDTRSITSTLKMQIWIATNNRDVSRVMKTNPKLIRTSSEYLFQNQKC